MIYNNGWSIIMKKKIVIMIVLILFFTQTPLLISVKENMNTQKAMMG